jgi:hypothetical protein
MMTSNTPALFFGNFLSCFLLAGCSDFPDRQSMQIIPVSFDNITDESGMGNCIYWFDEQDVTATPDTRWETPEDTACWPAGMVIDLGQSYQISKIGLYDAVNTGSGSAGGFSQGIMQVFTGEPFRWVLECEYQAKQEGCWTYIKSGFTTRYIRLVKKCARDRVQKDQFSCDLSINEVVFFGVPVDKAFSPGIIPVEQTNQKYSMDDMMGINTSGIARSEDHSMAGSLKTCVPMGRIIMHPPGAQILTEKSLADPQQTGSVMIRFMEVGNYEGLYPGVPSCHTKPYRAAAMASAAYDGHMGKLGASAGIKQADPSIRLVLTGIPLLSLHYLKAIRLWSCAFRKDSFPADAIGLCRFCSTGDGDGDQSHHGISPEADNLKARLQELVRWRNRELPGKEIWLTEFGWDTRDDSPCSATGHTQYPESAGTLELQALWLVRAYLAGSAAGIERMFMPRLRDGTGSDPLSSSGILDIHGNPKKSWYYVSSLGNVLKGMYFRREIMSGDPDVWIYQYMSPDSSRSVLVMWCPTSDGTEVKNYKLSLEGSPDRVSMVELMAGFENGLARDIQLTHGTLMVHVTEKPVFIVLDN